MAEVLLSAAQHADEMCLVYGGVSWAPAEDPSVVVQGQVE